MVKTWVVESQIAWAKTDLKEPDWYEKKWPKLRPVRRTECFEDVLGRCVTPDGRVKEKMLIEVSSSRKACRRPRAEFLQPSATQRIFFHDMILIGSPVPGRVTKVTERVRRR